MKIRRILCKTVATALCVWLLAALPLSVSAAGYRNGRIDIVSEPENFSAADVSYYVGKERKSAADMVWVDNGYEGKALKLSGNGEFLRLGHYTARVGAFTFSAWVNWQSEPGADTSGQRLLTVARSTNNYITLSPYMKNEALKKDGGSLDGVYLRYQFGGEQGKVVDMFNPASEGVTYALPTGEWHHVALTSNGRTYTLYIDGVRWFNEPILTTLAELQAYSIDIGNGEWGDPTLNALLDNVSIYNSALSEARILELANRTGETQPPYRPTAPSTTAPTTPTTATPTEPPMQEQHETLGRTLFGIPLWSVYTIGGILLVYIALTVLAGVKRKREKEEQG